MARDSRGRIYVTWQNYGHGPELVAVYDSSGRFLQELGRKGKGPGEFEYPVTINVGRGDRIFIWDIDRRATLFDADYRFVRQHIQSAGTLLVLAGDRQILGASALDRDGRPAPITVVDSIGNHVAAFGASNEPLPDAEAWRWNRVVGSAGSDAVWTFFPDRYRLERWSLSGALTRVFVRTPAWFARPTTARAIIHRGEEPTPEPRAVREDSNGRLWYFASVAARDWRAALGQAKTTPGRPTIFPNVNRSQSYDTVIDVIDVKTGTLLASQRVDAYLQFFLADGLIAGFREDRDGQPFIDIWRVQLRTQ
ncbi:MAG TPA: 6-bladed beta-propeller [Gemmatimonadaceae bacterium]|nr:6-bladed beta-propeller [Gemmatimonadaceae bacterium]